MLDMGVVNGLSQLGYTSEDIPQLVEGTLPQVPGHIYTHDHHVCVLGGGSTMKHVLETCVHDVAVFLLWYVCGCHVMQERVTKLSPRKFTEENLAKIFEESLTVY